MKTKNILVYGFIAVILMFAFIACDDGNDPNGGNPNGNDPNSGKTSFGDKLELSGQVYTMEWDDDNGGYVFSKFEGDLALKSDTAWGASGEIKGGKLNYTVGTPPAVSLSSITSWFWIDDEDYDGYFTDITISDESVKFAELNIEVSSNTYHFTVGKGNVSGNESGYTQESVMFMYVDNPVTITAKGKTETEDGHTRKTNDINLSLEKGWNAIYQRYSYSQNTETKEGTTTRTISVSNPDLKWALWAFEPENDDSDW